MERDKRKGMAGKEGERGKGKQLLLAHGSKLGCASLHLQTLNHLDPNSISPRESLQVQSPFISKKGNFKLDSVQHEAVRRQVSADQRI